MPISTSCHTHPLCTYDLTTSTCYTTSAIYSLPPVTSSPVAKLHSQPLTERPSITPVTGAVRRPQPLGYLLPWPLDLLTHPHCHHLCACQIPLPRARWLPTNKTPIAARTHFTAHFSQASDSSSFASRVRLRDQRASSTPPGAFPTSPEPSRAFAAPSPRLLPQLRRGFQPQPANSSTLQR